MVIGPLQTELWTAEWLNFRLQKVKTEDVLSDKRMKSLKSVGVT